MAGPVSPGYRASLVGVWGPGYLGGASPWPELGVCGAGPGVPGPLLSHGAGVLGSPPTDGETRSESRKLVFGCF